MVVLNLRAAKMVECVSLDDEKSLVSSQTRFDQKIPGMILDGTCLQYSSQCLPYLLRHLFSSRRERWYSKTDMKKKYDHGRKCVKPHVAHIAHACIRSAM